MVHLGTLSGSFLSFFVNVEGSSIDQESNGVIYTNAGPEIGVASTKNYIGQLLTIYLFSLYLGRIRETISYDKYLDHLDQIKKLPVLIEQVPDEDEIKDLVDRYFESKSFIFIGRGLNYPTALEGVRIKRNFLHSCDRVPCR